MVPSLPEAPRGNTQKNVNRDVMRYIRDVIRPAATVRWLDVPCGTGEFLQYAHQVFPAAALHGVDLFPSPQPEFIRFRQADLSREFPFASGETFELLTSISGVMMFGNTQFFLEHCGRHLAPGGWLLVSNDNFATIRDRLSFLFFGRVRRFKLLYAPGEGITQMVPVQELHRLLTNQGVEVKDVIYSAFYPEDLLFLPFVLLAYPLQYLHLMRIKSPVPKTLRRKMLGWKSLLYRHYTVVGQKK